MSDRCDRCGGPVIRFAGCLWCGRDPREPEPRMASVADSRDTGRVKRGESRLARLAGDRGAVDR